MTESVQRPMRVAIIAAGAAGSYCGACTRDVTLARTLSARGHDVQVLPLYTPLRIDGPDPSLNRVFFGGINVYLTQRWSLFAHMPGFLKWLLDRPGLLRLVSRFGIETNPENLGEMTVSMLEGEGGHQRGEMEALAGYLREECRPDAIILSNSLLLGLVPGLRESVGAKLLCNLAGEDSFVDRLGEPFRSRALALMRHLAGGVDAFVSPGQAYAEEMTKLLEVQPERVRVVRTGVVVPAIRPERPAGEPIRVSFLSRLCASKGLDTLCEAFRIMHGQDAVLAVAGQANSEDARFWRKCRAGLARAGCMPRLDYRGELDARGKQEFLNAVDLFCLPERVSEPRGVACLEAMAAGAPALVPDHGIFPEIAELTSAAVCVPPDDPQRLAEAIVALIEDRDALAQLGRAARRGVEEYFSAERMASETEALLRELL